MKGDSIDLGPWIHTYPTGKHAHVLFLQQEEIEIADIARSLSMQCRYVGHVNRFYSVAEHCCRVSDKALSETFGDEHMGIWGLLHDASEAYTGDMSRPLKYSPGMRTVYKEIELRIMNQICLRFGLPVVEPALITRLDDEILGPEVAQLKPNLNFNEWAITTASGVLAPTNRYSLDDIGWTWHRAEAEFLARFSRLYHG